MSKRHRTITAVATTIKCDHCGARHVSLNENELCDELYEDGWYFVRKKGKKHTLLCFYPDDANKHFCSETCWKAYQKLNGVKEEDVIDESDFI